MLTSHKARLAPIFCALLTLWLAAARPAAAQVVLTGSHDSTNSSGYDATGSFLIPVDTSAGPSATFNNNNTGLHLEGETKCIVTGGQFNGNSGFALDASDGGNIVTISGGHFTGKDQTAVNAANRAKITITGGTFSGNKTDFAADGGETTIDLYGQFAGLEAGQVQVLPTGYGTFSGTLENDAAPAQTFTYKSDNSAVISLHGVAALTGHHDNQKDGKSGSDPQGPFSVPADTTTGPSATFDNNALNGLSASSAAPTGTISGGEFVGNKGDGLYSKHSAVTVTGGKFSGNGTDFHTVGGTIDVYGQFTGLTAGQIQTLPGTSGTFHGTLENNTAPALTYTYKNETGTIRLHQVAQG